MTFSNIETTFDKSFFFGLKNGQYLRTLAIVLYSFFGFQFLLAGLILLVAIIGAVFLTLEEINKSKKVDFFKQIIKTKRVF